jgi:transcriptional regulator with XRE-family HTH domain
VDIGAKIKQVRQEQGLTQQELAHASGVCQQMISKLEVGKARSTADIVKLAYALQISPTWLQGLSADKTETGQRRNEAKSSGGALNRKAVQACIEYLSDKALLFKHNNIRRQADIFSACYELCTRPQNMKQSKAELVAMLSRRKSF